MNHSAVLRRSLHRQHIHCCLKLALVSYQQQLDSFRTSTHYWKFSTVNPLSFPTLSFQAGQNCPFKPARNNKGLSTRKSQVLPNAQNSQCSTSSKMGPDLSWSFESWMWDSGFKGAHTCYKFIITQWGLRPHTCHAGISVAKKNKEDQHAYTRFRFSTTWPMCSLNL